MLYYVNKKEIVQNNMTLNFRSEKPWPMFLKCYLNRPILQEKPPWKSKFVQNFKEPFLKNVLSKKYSFSIFFNIKRKLRQFKR